MATRDHDKANRGRGKPEDETSFLSRWSQRKRAVEAEAEAEDKEVHKPDGAAAVPGDMAASDDGKIDPAALPDIDSLDAGSDFTVFLKEGVPDALRRRALRKLWRLDPVFGHLDGLNDYDLDYSNAATVVEGLKTVYQVGKGMVLGEEEEVAREGDDKKAEPKHGSTGEAAAPQSAPQVAGATPASTEAGEAEAGDSGGASTAASNSRSNSGERRPGDPLVTPAPVRHQTTARAPQRSALRRRWGDPKT